MTLAEMLIAVFVLSIGIGSTLLFFTNALVSVDYAGDLTMASAHAEHILEEMRSRKTLKDITTTNWEEWSEENVLNALPEEAVEISFANVETNPLQVTAKVHWVKKSRKNDVTFMTSILK